jgi:hypothetical protein
MNVVAPGLSQSTGWAAAPYPIRIVACMIAPSGRFCWKINSPSNQKTKQVQGDVAPVVVGSALPLLSELENAAVEASNTAAASAFII